MTESSQATPGDDVLLVEDELELREAMTWLFAEENIPLRLAANGAEAVEQARAGAPALILLDLTMPGMGSGEVIQRLRADPRTAEVPILLLSAVIDLEMRARELGADGAIAKPYDLDDLIRVVRERARNPKW
jgi:CheY-like chemotaxis protein